MQCPNCKSKVVDANYDRKGWTFCNCQSCGFGWSMYTPDEGM